MDRAPGTRTEEEKKLKVGEGFNDARGDDFRQSAEVPKHNGLNVNNDPNRQKQKERENVARSNK